MIIQQANLEEMQTNRSIATYNFRYQHCHMQQTNFIRSKHISLLLYIVVQYVPVLSEPAFVGK